MKINRTAIVYEGNLTEKQLSYLKKEVEKDGYGIMVLEGGLSVEYIEYDVSFWRWLSLTFFGASNSGKGDDNDPAIT